METIEQYTERWVINLMNKIYQGQYNDVYTILISANTGEYRPAMLFLQQVRPELFKYILEAREYAMNIGLIKFSKDPQIDPRIIDILARKDVTIRQAINSLSRPSPVQNNNPGKYYKNLFNQSYPNLNVMQKIRIFSKEWLNKNLTNKSPKKIALALHPDKNPPNLKYQSELLFKMYTPIMQRNREN